jgi:mycoredoxin
MRRFGLALAAACILLASLRANAAHADILVLRDGTEFQTKGPWKADDRKVEFFDLKGNRRAMSIEMIDVGASRERSFPGSVAPQTSRVTLYATSWCGWCRKTRELLASLNVPYVEKDIEKDTAGRAEYAQKVDPKVGVPVLDMAGEVVVGYSEVRIRTLVKDKALARQ